MKRILFIALFLLLSLQVFSQQTDLYLIKLKSGLTLKAELVKVVPDSFVIIRQYGLESKINMTDILEIYFAESNPNAYIHPGKPIVFKRNIPDSGWTYGFQLGFTLGTDLYGATTSFTSRFLALRTIATKTQVGFSAGIDPYDLYSSILATTQIDIRQYLRKGTQSPMLYGYTGYGFNLSSNNPVNYGGVNYGVGIGQSFRTNNQKLFSVMVGFKHQTARSQYSPGGSRPSYTHYLSINRLEIKLECIY